MGSIGGSTAPVSVRVLDSSASEATRTAAVCAKLAVTCDEATLYTDATDCLNGLSRINTDVLIVDLETIGGEDELEGFAVRCPSSVIIAVSSQGSISRAVSAMRSGAHDFLTKPFSLDALASKITFQLQQRRPPMPRKPEAVETSAAPVRASTPLDTLTHPAAQSSILQPSFAHAPFAQPQKDAGLDKLIGASTAMHEVYDKIRRMAPSQAPVFITGESGTGKELCANAIHTQSDRKDAPFIALNCAAIPRDLIESEIFGHMRGAFTGATDTRIGAAEQADGGTLFLDEIGEMDLHLQSKLLRFLQTGTFQRLGETATRKVDARIICATNRNPLDEIGAGRFREDLYYRLHVLPIQLPSLRERRDDILLLAESFLRRYSKEEGRSFMGFDADAEAALVTYTWPGNVRQLENTIRQIVVMNDGVAITHAMLPLLIRDPSRRQTPSAVVDLSRERAKSAAPTRAFGSIEPLWAQERRIIETALDAFDGNIAMAAAALEISPSTIYRKRQSWMAKGV